MSFLSGLTLVAGAVGVATSFAGAKQSEKALNNQAAQIEALSEEERAFILRQSEIEAGLILEDARDEMEVARHNQQIALENARWAQASGQISLRQAARRWEAQVSDVVARMGASGAVIDATSPILQDQIEQMNEDLFVLRLNQEREVRQATRQAGFYSLRAGQIDARANRQRNARLELGHLEAETAGTAAAARASAARTQAQSASISGTANLFTGVSGLAGSMAEYYG